ncbi:MAG: hypothetical protein K2X81_20935, partial [Candidatus Obscuribacterales bacterium]|nr:hypothetical protein [Candidatus Obscuribacterales bacterium]
MTTKAENDQTEILHKALDRAANSDSTYAAAEGNIKRATESKELAPMSALDKIDKEAQKLEINPTRPAVSDATVPTRLEQLQGSTTDNQELKKAIPQLATLFDNSLLKSIINTSLEKKLNDYFNSPSASGRQNALEQIKNEALSTGSPESIAIMKASLTFDAGMRLLESRKSGEKSENADEKLAMTDLATLARNNTPAAMGLLEKYASNTQTDTAAKDSQSEQIKNNLAAAKLIKEFAASAGNSEQPKLTQLQGQIAALGRDAFVSGNTPLQEAAAWANLAAPIAARVNARGEVSDIDLARSLSDLSKLAKSGNRQATAIIDGIFKDPKSAGLRDLLPDSESLTKALSTDSEKVTVLKQAFKPVLEQLAQVKNGNEQEIAAMFGLSIPAEKTARDQKVEKDAKAEKTSSSGDWKEIKDQKGTRFEKHTADGGSLTKNEKGQLTELKNANGESRTFEYNTDGSAKAMREPGGRRWQSEDGEHWKSEDSKESRVFQFQITEDGRYFERNEAGAIKALAIDGSSITTDAQGRIIETLSKNNQRRAYEYDGYARSPSAILEGTKGKEQVWTRNELKIVDETKSAGAAEWTSPGKQPFKGIKQLHADGSLESIDLKGNKRVEILDGRTLERNADGKPTFVKEASGKEHTLNYKDGKLT